MRLWLGVGVLVAVACVLVLPAASAVGGASSPAALSVPSAATVDHPGAVTPRAARQASTRGSEHWQPSRARKAPRPRPRARSRSGSPSSLEACASSSPVRRPPWRPPAVRAVGGTVEVGAGSGVQALVPSQSLRAVAQRPGVRNVAPPARPVPLAVAGEEVGSTGAAGWQTAGITGAGVKVAIIDVGFAGLASAQATGDLPASVLTQDDCAGGFSTVTQHGTAVAEIVHELAPSAQLLLACVDTPADLATAEQWAVAQGAQIINHSVAWFNTARGDGQGGAGHAGRGRRRRRGARRPLGQCRRELRPAALERHLHADHRLEQPDVGELLGWRPRPVGLRPRRIPLLRLPALGRMAADAAGRLRHLHLPRRRHLAGRGLDQRPDVRGSSDRGGVLHGARGRDVLRRDQQVRGRRFSAARSLDRQCGQRAVPGRERQRHRPRGQLRAPSPSARACWQSGGLEPFSSQGPTIDGRVKPDLAAADRMSSFTYGSFDSCGGVGGFAGTSASSPTVAGMAALVKQLYPSDTRGAAARVSHLAGDRPGPARPRFPVRSRPRPAACRACAAGRHSTRDHRLSDARPHADRDPGSLDR